MKREIKRSDWVSAGKQVAVPSLLKKGGLKNDTGRELRFISFFAGDEDGLERQEDMHGCWKRLIILS